MSDEESGEKMVIEVPGDDNVRKEIISYLRSGKIDYNYQIESNFFTSEKNKHNEIIGIWEEEYGSRKILNAFLLYYVEDSDDVNY
ncbi:24473_t:CDS:2, partial [Racocetra persica]